MVKESFKDKKVTIMGLGLHGGGLASALFFLKEGSKVTITDLRPESILRPTLDKLKDYEFNLTLEKHIDSDFKEADIVIKNPGVPSSSPYLKMANRVESDISIFLSRVKSPIIAITGSKGKSSTVSAIYHVLKKVNADSKLGGNITVSPLTFINEVKEDTPVVLELSSWQLNDLRGKTCFKPNIAAVTNIMNDHQNAYNSMDEYAGDKGVILENVKDWGIINYNDSYRDLFKNILKKQPLYFSNKPEDEDFTGAFLDKDKNGWLQEEGQKTFILPNELTIPGEHQRENLLLAGMILLKFGLKPEVIREGLKEFKGIAHRMELFHEKNGVKFYNDSAATIPEAVCAAIEALKGPVKLISGGTDKELEFDIIKDSFKLPKEIYLLNGTGTDKMLPILDRENIDYFGPYDSLKSLIDELKQNLQSGDSVLFSPGATSFGMFNNEFHRGNQFKEIISRI